MLAFNHFPGTGLITPGVFLNVYKILVDRANLCLLLWYRVTALNSKEVVVDVKTGLLCGRPHHQLDINTITKGIYCMFVRR